MFRGHGGRQIGEVASSNVMQEMQMKPLARCQHFHITKNSIKQKLQFIFLPFAKKWTSRAVFENICKRPQLVNLQLSANFHYKVVKTRRGSHSYGLSWTRYHEQGKKKKKGPCLKAAFVFSSVVSKHSPVGTCSTCADALSHQFVPIPSNRIILLTLYATMPTYIEHMVRGAFRQILLPLDRG